MIEDSRDISGSGGGGGGGKSKKGGASAPQEANVSLQSRAYATALFLIGEGAIQGSVNADLAKSIYINETPLKNADNTFNFNSVWSDIRVGNPIQSMIPLTGSMVGSSVRVDTKVTQAFGAITRTISDSTATAYSILVYTPALRHITDKDIKGTEVRYRVEISTNGGAYVTDFEDTISGYTPSGYERTIERLLPAGTSWSIRMSRLTADSNSSSLNNDLYWSAYTALTEVKLTYPNSALFAVRVAADQFSSIPKFAIHLDGKICLIPHNYNPTTRAYTGSFNGSLVPGYTSNPAWVFYDLATNPRYGLGKYIPETSMDVYALYAIAQYCDELVPNGRGGWEPRFTCNIYLKEEDDAANVLSDLASIFRGMTYYAGGTVVAVQDRPRTPVRIFTEANVIQTTDDEGRITEPAFRYSGSAQRAIHTVAIVYWQDEDDFGRTVPEYVDDPDQVVRFGYNPIEVRGIGCTSKSQARRIGEWILKSEKVRTQTITFRAAGEGLLMLPNEVIKVYDPLKGGSRRAGRIVSATTTSITIDAPVTLLAATTYTLTIMTPGAVPITRVLNNAPGTGTGLTWASPLAADQVPMANQVWGIESSDIMSSLWQVVSIAPQEGSVFEVVAIEYSDGLYAWVDRDQPIPARDTTTFDDPRNPPKQPQSLAVEQSLYQTNGASGVKTRLDVSWMPNPTANATSLYELQWRTAGDTAWRNSIRTDQNTYSVYDAVYGTYEFRVRSVSSLGTYSTWVYWVFANSGLTAAPSTPTGFNGNAVDNFATLRWDTSSDLDVRVGGKFTIKHTRKTDGATWADGEVMAEVGGSTTVAQVPLRSGTYLIKAVDSSGYESINPATVIMENVGEIVIYNVVQTIDESANGWTGTKTNTIYNTGALKILTSGYFDSTAGNFDSAAGNFDVYGGAVTIFSPGTYDFAAPVDLGEVFSSKITVAMEAVVVDESQLFDVQPGNFDDRAGLFEGAQVTGATATLYVSTSQDNIVWSAYTPVTAADYRARAFKFRLILDSNGTNYNVYVYSLKVVIDMPDRVEGNVQTIPAAATVISFNPRFKATPAIGVTIQNGASGDYATVSGESATGFTIVVKNSANTAISRTVSWIAKGYGRG